MTWAWEMWGTSSAAELAPSVSLHLLPAQRLYSAELTDNLVSLYLDKEA